MMRTAETADIPNINKIKQNLNRSMITNFELKILYKIVKNWNSDRFINLGIGERLR